VLNATETPWIILTVEDIDSMKHPDAIKQMVAAEATKSYPPSQVAVVVKELSKESGLNERGSKFATETEWPTKQPPLCL